MSDGVLEAMLLRWGESPTGRTVTFLLPEDDGSHPFKGLPTGPTNGQRLALSVVLINDDETTKPKPNGSEKPKSYAQRAGILSNDPVFWRYLAYITNPHLTFDAESAAAELRAHCRVKSRRDLIEGTEAGNRFRDLEASFKAWKMVA